MARARFGLLVCVAIAALGAYFLFVAGCSGEPERSRQATPVASVRRAKVGETVVLPVGDVTLESITTTPPARMGRSMRPEHDPSVWLNLRYVNSTDTTVAVPEGFRSPPRPEVTAGGGARTDVVGSSGSFTGGQGGWELTGGGVELAPGGVVHASFGVRVDDYSPGVTALTIDWKPAGDLPARFESP